MSRWQREHGSIKLPSAEFAGFRQAAADAANKEKQSLFDHSQNFWAGLKPSDKKDRASYYQAYLRYEKANEVAVQRSTYWGSRGEMVSGTPDGFSALIGADLSSVGRKPARVQKSEMGFATNRTVELANPYGDGRLVFNREQNTVSWDVEEGNRAVDSARDSVIGKLFFNRLKSVKWSRGTGGTIMGNSESMSDDDYVGDGGSYFTGGFGPIGAELNPWGTDRYRLTTGVWVERSQFPEVRRQEKDLARLRQSEATKKATAARRLTKRNTEAASAAAGSPQGRVGANNGSHGGEFATKSQSAPEVTL
jgi:hypothetical protein